MCSENFEKREQAKSGGWDEEPAAISELHFLEKEKRGSGRLAGAGHRPTEQGPAERGIYQHNSHSILLRRVFNDTQIALLFKNV